MKLSKKVESMQFSPIRRFNPFGFKAEADGKKVYHLNIGRRNTRMFHGRYQSI
jgi:aspartate aminotransferase